MRMSVQVIVECDAGITTDEAKKAIDEALNQMEHKGFSLAIVPRDTCELDIIFDAHGPISPNRLFGWDEIGNEISQLDPEEATQMNREGGWFHLYGSDDTNPDVAVLSTGKHIALETWAPDSATAAERFAKFPTYKEYNDGV